MEIQFGNQRCRMVNSGGFLATDGSHLKEMETDDVLVEFLNIEHQLFIRNIRAIVKIADTTVLPSASDKKLLYYVFDETVLSFFY